MKEETLSQANDIHFLMRLIRQDLSRLDWQHFILGVRFDCDDPFLLRIKNLVKEHLETKLAEIQNEFANL